jgi:hypothetical protein
MTIETLTLLRNFLLRTFVVGLVLGIVLSLLTFWQWEMAVRLLVNTLGMASRESLGTAVLDLFLAIRFFLLFCILTPALALHWTIKRMG